MIPCTQASTSSAFQPGGGRVARALWRFRHLRRVPWYTLSMFAVYMAVYFTVCTDAADPRNDALRLALRAGDAGEVYRWYTYSLLHLNGMHLGLNMLGLCAYGALVEFDHGFLRVFVIHTCSILGGAYGAGWESRTTGRQLFVIGESGGNFGLLSSQAANLVLNWPEIGLLQRVVYVSLLVSATLSEVVANVVLAPSMPNVSYSAHVGGFVFGVFAGLAAMRNIRVLAWERTMQLACGAVFLGITVASVTNLALL